ncbi:BrnT family toxin [Burkholderia sp. Nafp2/4-1b]|uniref:BrnT family toxin n=1 Tax=Burkholderia sp. Nafp2/4-1b TaxID=2116686 RepID=UPI001969FD41|nr:BrnT family toxin [Burkholderia sp. Nafp2/4-1b]
MQQITYDESKSATNCEKHGVPLSHARFIEWETLWSRPDTRHAHGEERVVGYAHIGPGSFAPCSPIATTAVASSA